MISRGIRMTPQERDKIVPLLAVFEALFGYLLVRMNYFEFTLTNVLDSVHVGALEFGHLLVLASYNLLKFKQVYFVKIICYEIKLFN